MVSVVDCLLHYPRVGLVPHINGLITRMCIGEYSKRKVSLSDFNTPVNVYVVSGSMLV